MRYLLFIIIFPLLVGCYAVGHKDYVNIQNNILGEKTTRITPFQFKNAGSLIGGNFLISGQGITHISYDNKGNLITHWDDGEVLPSFHGNKKWIGKCLIYEVIDPKTHIVKSWGFDEGGNPLSCRTWL